eukprot:TRINITY_DN5104_c0_g1_i2.p1 TRINITY_DN5104_c0_g1~~TRINITY_DN5104_c0_g1_i2.p1  ORF type:complete len:461 (-),score=147.35 TRINITY_DN5104_c0_g1_i2:11-1333(-)
MAETPPGQRAVSKEEEEKQLSRATPSAWHAVVLPEPTGASVEAPITTTAVWAASDKYIEFISAAKTERLFVARSVQVAEAAGFKALSSMTTLAPGSKVYATFHNKNIMLAIIGSAGVSMGMNIIASHLDSPRLDLKPNPLVEDADSALAFFKTHYYGGLKKYQWVQLQLALIGVVVLKSGETVEINIGTNPTDPVFMIADILPHLSTKVQNNTAANEAIKGEQLNIICGSIPVRDGNVKQKVKFTVLSYLNRRFGIKEEDFLSAELEAVPANPARYVGFDRGLIAGYGQDDKVCAWSNLEAITQIKETPQKTVVAFLADKEEIGSIGATGMKSNVFLNNMRKLVYLTEPNANEVRFADVLEMSNALSTDVTVAVDPNFKEVHDMHNAAKVGYGVCLTKYTGSRGKSGANDADAEYIAKLRGLLDGNNVGSLPQSPKQLSC